MEITAEGFLTKRGHKFKNWRVRYFWLTPGGILRYSKAKNAKAKGSWNVVGAEVARLPDDAHARPHCFELRRGAQVLTMQATNDEEREKWASALTASSTAGIVHEGPLAKWLKWKKNWRSRFFTLQGSVLSFYVKKGSGLLGELSVVGAKAGRTILGSYDNVFYVETASDKYLLKAETEESAEDWLRVIQLAAGVAVPEQGTEKPAPSPPSPSSSPVSEGGSRVPVAAPPVPVSASPPGGGGHGPSDLARAHAASMDSDASTEAGGAPHAAPAEPRTDSAAVPPPAAVGPAQPPEVPAAEDAEAAGEDAEPEVPAVEPEVVEPEVPTAEPEVVEPEVPTAGPEAAADLGAEGHDDTDEGDNVVEEAPTPRREPTEAEAAAAATTLHRFAAQILAPARKQRYRTQQLQELKDQRLQEEADTEVEAAARFVSSPKAAADVDDAGASATAGDRPDVTVITTVDEERAWVAEEDDPQRVAMRSQIREYLVSQASRSSSAHSRALARKLPELVPRLETALYNMADSEEAFTDPETLQDRLRDALRRKPSSTRHLHSFQRDSATLDTPTSMALSPDAREGAGVPYGSDDGSDGEGSVLDSASVAGASVASGFSAGAAALGGIPAGRTSRSSSMSASSWNAPLPPPPSRGGPARYGMRPHPGVLPIHHFPSQPDGGLHMRLVLDQRYSKPPHLPTINKWQKRQCARCCVTQSTGMFGMKAHYCHYTELLFCTDCFGSETRPIPWRVVHSLDMKPRKVSKMAAGFIDTIWTLPIVEMSTASPRQFARRSTLQHTRELRVKLCKLKNAVVDEVETKPLLRRHLGVERMYMADSEEMLSFPDVPRAVAGAFLDPLRGAIAALQKLASRVGVDVE